MMKRAVWQVTSVLLLFGAVLAAACTGVNGVPEAPDVPQESVEQGRLLIASYGCGSCHTIPNIPGADSRVGPPLDHFFQRRYIAGHLPNTWDNLAAWIQNPQAIEPGTAMPNLGVTEADARLMAAYLYHEPDLFDLVRR